MPSSANNERNGAAKDGSSHSRDAASMSVLASTVEKNEQIRVLYDIVEREIVERVCMWCCRVLVYGPGIAAFMAYIGGDDLSQVMNPLLVSLFASCNGLFSRNIVTQMAANLCFMTCIILRHSLKQGCSACLVPAIYGFVPCATGFMFRSIRAVVLSTVGVLSAIFVIYAVDLTGNCASEPIDPSDRETIIADRLIPLLMLILGNSLILTVILRQSQESLLAHTRAATSASNLADMRKDVLHRVTHELRTPLNGIVGSVELLTSSETIMDHDMENAVTIQRCLSTILDICDSVLMAAKSDQVSNENSFALVSCVDHTAEIFAASAEAKGVQVKVEFDGHDTIVRGLEVKLRQILLNLVGNALKFTDSGSITIRLHTEEEPSDMLRCAFEVEDTGIGIDRESSDMLFEPFHQGERGAVSRQHKGTGLGLTICRDLVDMMGGELAVDSARNGQGARFFFTLLLPEVKQNVSSPSSQVATRCRVVIADSEKESSTSCRSLVKSRAPSADVTSVTSIEALLNIVATEKETEAMVPRIAFLEWKASDAEPESLLARMRNCGWLVFLFCDYGTFTTVVGKCSSAYGVFRRPLQLERLGDCIRRALSGMEKGDRSIPSSIDTKDPITGVDWKKQDTKEMDAKMWKEDKRTPKRSIESDDSAQDATRSSVTCSSLGSALASVSRPTLQESTSTFPRPQPVAAAPGSKVVVVDDTPINVKVLVKMLKRSTNLPILALSNGQSAIDLVESSSNEDRFLFLMDWHMPGVCGLRATECIRRISERRGGPSLYVCLVTADIEGLFCELERRQIWHRFGTVENGQLKFNKNTARSSEQDAIDEMLEDHSSKSTSIGSAEYAVLDLVAGKPVTFQSIQAILQWFQREVEKAEGCDSE